MAKWWPVQHLGAKVVSALVECDLVVEDEDGDRVTPRWAAMLATLVYYGPKGQPVLEGSARATEEMGLTWVRLALLACKDDPDPAAKGAYLEALRRLDGGRDALIARLQVELVDQ